MRQSEYKESEGKVLCKENNDSSIEQTFLFSKTMVYTELWSHLKVTGYILTNNRGVRTKKV